MRNANPLARLLTLLETNICDIGRYFFNEFSNKLDLKKRFINLGTDRLNTLLNCGHLKMQQKKIVGVHLLLLHRLQTTKKTVIL